MLERQENRGEVKDKRRILLRKKQRNTKRDLSGKSFPLVLNNGNSYITKNSLKMPFLAASASQISFCCNLANKLMLIVKVQEDTHNHS